MGIICYSLKNAYVEYCTFMALTRVNSAVEVRLDCCPLEEDDIKKLFSLKNRAALVATYHTSLPSQLDSAAEQLTTAVLYGADYVDIPLDWPESTRQWLMNLAFNKGCKVILSYHNYSGTDSLDSLMETGRKAQYLGADIIKIVTTAHCEADEDTVLELYKHFEPSKLIAFAMGEEGKDSRLQAFASGCPLFYLSTSRNDATAPGQPQFFDFLEDKAILLRGEADIPSSKSYVQRAILLSALAEGTTKLYGAGVCDDVTAAIGVAESLYADVSVEGSTITVTGHQNIEKEGLKIRDNLLHVGESGLMARLCIPLAGLAKGTVTITGDKTLLRRKVNEHRKELKQLGLTVSYTDKCHLPVTVKGRLHSGEITVDGSAGSQMISGLLLALSQCKEDSSIRIENATSVPYLELTTYIAQFFGLTEYDCESKDSIDYEDDPDFGCTSYFVGKNQTVVPVQGLEVEKDWSAAAMLMVAGAIMGDITLRGMDIFSLQADAVILDLMKSWHIDIEQDNDIINVRKSIISPFFYDITDCPDLFAPLFLLASRAEGETLIRGVSRLRNKESDRAFAFQQEFSKLGVDSVFSGEDDLLIYGHEHGLFKKAKCSSHGDHRLAMALSIASLLSDGGIVVDDTACVTKSFPDFYTTLESLKKK